MLQHALLQNSLILQQHELQSSQAAQHCLLHSEHMSHFFSALLQQTLHISQQLLQQPSHILQHSFEHALLISQQAAQRLNPIFQELDLAQQKGIQTTPLSQTVNVGGQQVDLTQSTQVDAGGVVNDYMAQDTTSLFQNILANPEQFEGMNSSDFLLNYFTNSQLQTNQQNAREMLFTVDFLIQKKILRCKTLVMSLMLAGSECGRFRHKL